MIGRWCFWLSRVIFRILCFSQHGPEHPGPSWCPAHSLPHQKVPVPGWTAPDAGSPASMSCSYLDGDGSDDARHTEDCRTARTEPEPHTTDERSGGLVRLRGIGATENFRPRSRQDNSHGFYRLVLQIGSQDDPDVTPSIRRFEPLPYVHCTSFLERYRRGRFAVGPGTIRRFRSPQAPTGRRTCANQQHQQSQTGDGDI